MPTKIRISGEIGWMVFPDEILDQLDNANGDDLDIEIASPGGSVFAGLEIFNALRAYKKTNPKSQILITITGLAASMASYIAAVDVADLVAAYDNTVMMIHNPWNISLGDYREMRKNADFLEGLSDLLARAYVKRSGKDRGEVTTMMNDETWLFGAEIMDAGFADEMIAAPEDDDGDQDRASAVATAQLRYREMRIHAKDHEEKPEKVAAIMREVSEATPTRTDTVQTVNKGKQKTSAKTAVGGTHKSTPAQTGKEGKAMDLKELMAEHPETYAEAVASGAKREQERVAALMKMKQSKAYSGIAAVQEVLDECIGDGTSKDEATALVIATLTNNNTAQAEADSPGDIVTSTSDTATGETAHSGGFESAEEV